MKEDGDLKVSLKEDGGLKASLEGGRCGKPHLRGRTEA